jgi:hypothetical protein
MPRQTWTITIDENGPHPSSLPAAQGDWVVWVNATSEWYSVWDFAGPAGSPPLFQQTGYGIEPGAASGGEVISDDLGASYSYKCTAATGGIIIVEPPHGGTLQQTAQKSAQGSSSQPRASKALVTNGSRK